MIDTLLANSNITSYVEDRIYPEELPTIKDAEYPLITVLYDGGVKPGHIRDLSKVTIKITCYSSESHKQCQAIYDLVEDALFSQQNTNTNHGMVSFLKGTPVPYTIQTGDSFVRVLAADFKVFPR